MTTPTTLLAQTPTTTETRPANPIEGRLDSNSQQLEEDNSYYNVHTFTGEAGEQITIDLISEDFDSYLLLRSPEGDIITQDDDGGEGTNARIVLELPMTGQYEIVVNTYEAGETGSYTLSWREATADEFKLAEAERLNQQVIQLYQAGKYAEAIPLAEQILQIRRQVLGQEHPLVATSLNNLALLYESQGRYAEAEPLYRQALEMVKRLLGQEHPDVAQSLNNLAALYQSQGRYAEAEPLYRQALEMYKRLLGQEHPQVATSLNNLAALYQSQGRYAEAEPLYRQALEMYKR
ncbi:tetratricopeptide repeat protein, partial [Spirulina sp. CS-785/01]